MLVHKAFTEQMTSLTGKAALVKREKLREKAAKFISDEINEQDVVNITETAMAIGGLFSITVWYRKG